MASGVRRGRVFDAGGLHGPAKIKDKAVNTVADMKAKAPAKKGGAKKGARAGAKPKKAKKGVSAQTSAAGDNLPGRAAIQDILGRTDQIGAILSKGLDLAEAGIGLGMNLIGKLGSVAQEQVIGNIAKTVMPGQYGAQNAQERPTAPPYRRGEDEAGDAGADSRAMCIVNRRPLFPGSAVEISFSINNDSPANARKVHIEIDGFTGSAHGLNIPSELFSIRPADIEIAPMDFEKFVLAGAIPQDAPDDSYNGWLRLAGEDGIRMPVILIVTSRE